MRLARPKIKQSDIEIKYIKKEVNFLLRDSMDFHKKLIEKLKHLEREIFKSDLKNDPDLCWKKASDI